MSSSIMLTALVLCVFQTICADPTNASSHRRGFEHRRYGHVRGYVPMWNRAANAEISPAGLAPDPQHALAKLSTISSTLAPSLGGTGSPLARGLNGLGGAGGMFPSQSSNTAPVFNTPLVNAGSARSAPAGIIPTMAAIGAAAAATATPVRGQSPFPYQPTHFIDPTNNPTNATPQPPADSCSPTAFTCQAYKQCYPCYTNTGLPQCMTCLGLMRCTDANCQLKQMCNLCNTDSSMAVCAMAQPYCP